MYDVPAELLQHRLGHSFCGVHMSVHFVSYSDDGHVHATTQFSARALALARLTIRHSRAVAPTPAICMAGPVFCSINQSINQSIVL